MILSNNRYHLADEIASPAVSCVVNGPHRQKDIEDSRGRCSRRARVLAARQREWEVIWSALFLSSTSA